MTLKTIMNFSPNPWFAAMVVACILPSCIPVDDFGRPIPQNRRMQNQRPERPIPPDREQSAEEIESRRLAELEAKKQAQQGKKEENKADRPSENTPDRDPEETRHEVTPPPPPPPKNHPVAAIVPGKPGFVFSPFNNKVVDVKGIPSGTLVADPQYPPSEKKHFRVP